MATTEHAPASESRLKRLYGRIESAPAQAYVTAGIVAVCTVFVFAQLEPSLLFTDTTPAGGDMGAHVWAPDYLRNHLIPQGRLSGWTPDWYAGFPAYHFYMVVPSLFILVLDVVMPYNIAFKLVSVAGLVGMPAAAWSLGRNARLPFPGPALLAVAAVVFLFDRTFTIYGGNVASTLAGEFAFSLSLTFSLVFLGVVLRGLETGRHRVLAACLLALTALCHVIPAIFAVVAGSLAIVVHLDRHRLRWALTAGVVGGLLTSFWTVPFVLRRAYLNDMGWERLNVFWERLIPGPIGESMSRAFGGLANNGGADPLVGGDVFSAAFVLGVVGMVLSIKLRRRLGIFLSVVAVVAALGYLMAPQGRLWNARLLPFWYLCIYLLAAIAVAEAIRALARLRAGRQEEGSDGRWLRVGPIVAGAVVLGVVAMPLRAMPFGVIDAAGTYHWPSERFGFSSAAGDESFLTSWARWNYSGYEQKDAYPEFREVIDVMADVGGDHGCGRAMWEYDPTLDRFGTPMALMLLPYFTDGCIGSMEGLYFEASATTPYHFINQSALSATPSRAQRNLPYPALDVARGVHYLQMLGVRYYMAFSDAAVAQAEQVDDLTLVATTDPHAVTKDQITTDLTWRVYEIADSELVEPLTARPAVFTGVPEGGEGWLEAAMHWYTNTTGDDDVFIAADGPPEWERVPATGDPERVEVDPVEVSAIDEGNDSLSFEVSEPGTPVLVKTSYFPNWEVSGAEGPWRVAPNLMVVIPTDDEVVLTYGTTWVEWLAWGMTLLGVIGLVLLVRRGDVAMPPEPDPAAATGPDGSPGDDAPGGDGPGGGGPGGDGPGGDGPGGGGPDHDGGESGDDGSPDDEGASEGVGNDSVLAGAVGAGVPADDPDGGGGRAP